MRKYRFLAVMLFIIMIVVPYACTLIFGTSYHVPEKTPDVPEGKEDIFNMEISLYRTKSGKVEKINCYDYICAVVAGEMQANYEKEALKAQAVASFTYMINKMNYVIQNPDSDIGHNGAYVCDDYTHCKAYLEKQDAAKKWGEDWFNKYYPNIETAVTLVLGKIITCDGAPINAVFHAISNGTTCSAKEVWGTEVSYLKSVDCTADKTSDGYKTEKIFSHKEFSDVFYEELGILLPDSAVEWIGNIEKADSGMINEITVAGTEYAGTHIRKLFSLRSATFDIEVTESDVIFTVYGYGHGVGMSQYGANQMAQNGSSFEQILKYFYTDVQIEDYKI